LSTPYLRGWRDGTSFDLRLDLPAVDLQNFTGYHTTLESGRGQVQRPREARELVTEELGVIVKGCLHLGELGHLNKEEKGTVLVNEYGKSYQKNSNCKVDKFYLENRNKGR
jgi:hypothetical protein